MSAAPIVTENTDFRLSDEQLAYLNQNLAAVGDFMSRFEYYQTCQTRGKTYVTDVIHNNYADNWVCVNVAIDTDTKIGVKATCIGANGKELLNYVVDYNSRLAPAKQEQSEDNIQPFVLPPVLTISEKKAELVARLDVLRKELDSMTDQIACVDRSEKDALIQRNEDLTQQMRQLSFDIYRTFKSFGDSAFSQTYPDSQGKFIKPFMQQFETLSHDLTAKYGRFLLLDEELDRVTAALDV